MGSIILGTIQVTIQVTMALLFFSGLAALFFDDHRYTGKDVIIGVVVFPYAIYVGGKEAHRYISTPSKIRESVSQCLNRTEAAGAPRKSRVKVCDCIGSHLSNPETNDMFLESEKAFVKCTGQTGLSLQYR